MRPPLSPGARRFAALGLLLVVLGGVWSLVIQPVMSAFTALDGDIGQARESLMRLNRVGALKNHYAVQLDDARRAQAIGRAAMSAATPQLAAADIQAKARNLISSSGSTLKSMQMLQTKEDGSFHRVSLRISMESDLDGLQSVLHGLESAVPYLIVANLEIRGRHGAAATNAGRRLPELAVVFDVHGYMRISGP